MLSRQRYWMHSRMRLFSGDERRVAKRRRAGDIPLEPFRVLVVEPHEDMLELCSYCLEADGNRVSTARDADEGFACALTECPDLIITELVLPRRGGFDLITQLRAHSLTMDLPVVVLTGMADQGTLAAAAAHGAAATLTKPAMPDAIQRTVREILARADPAHLVDRQLRRKLIAVRHLAQRLGGNAELRQHLARFIDSLQQAVLLLDEAGRLIAASRAAEFLTGYAEALTREHSVFEAIVAGKEVSTDCWGRACAAEHWSGPAEFLHRDGHTVTTRAVYMSAGVAGLHFAAFAPTSRAASGPA